MTDGHAGGHRALPALVLVACISGGCDDVECKGSEFRDCEPDYIDPFCTYGYINRCIDGKWGPCECQGHWDPPDTSTDPDVPNDPMVDSEDLPQDVPDDPVPDPDDLDAEDVEDEG